MKKIAIAGGGLAGLSACWALLQYPAVSVTLFDPLGIGEGASGVSAGLLHPFPGKWGRKSWCADEGMQASRALIDRVEEELGRPVSDRRGILRLAITGQQVRDFTACVDPQVEWWPKERVRELIPEAAPVGGLWIPQGITVYSRLYLHGLWSLCQKKGARLEQREVSSEGFDQVIMATGPLAAPLLSSPVKITRGQTLICRWPQPLPFSLLSQGHLTPTADPTLCQIGSTYEDPSTPLNPEEALALRDKIALFYPPARDFPVVETRVGFRVAREGGYRPFVLKIDPKTWVFAGLGSRGMLYHAWLGSALAEAVLGGYEALRPQEVYKSLSL